MEASSTSSPSMEELLLEEQPPPQAQQLQPQPASIFKEKDCIHKTKLVQFLGRTTPIVLQNDNGPCPLLAICNVLLLRNNLTLSPDTTEVSQEKLLSLVAERLIDSNINVNNRDAGYIENQQQNIADAIDLLPRLATGIDVNIKFRRIDDFEFTRECAIFDLLDIPLYHGWIVDTQDKDTTEAIADKSYNTIMGELVALETRAPDKEHKGPPEEDFVDFAAATTAALGVPSPCLSKVRSFNDPSHPVADDHVARRGDLLEEAELAMVLKLSEADVPNPSGPSSAVGIDGDDISVCPHHTENTGNFSRSTMELEDSRCVESSCHKKVASEPNTPATVKDPVELVSSVIPVDEAVASLSIADFGDQPDQSKQEKLEEPLLGCAAGSTKKVDSLVHIEDGSVTAKQFESEVKIKTDPLKETEEVGSVLASAANDVELAKSHGDGFGLSSSSAPYTGSYSSSPRLQHVTENGAFPPSIDDGEPFYEGEESVLDSQPTDFEDREPVYEGEVILAGQADKYAANAFAVGSTIDVTPQQGELIRNFLKNNASQLTFCGIFSLQEGLKERELCVFFRNNHFSTMFKYEGQLYLLATDQGYIHQSDLVWEKLNEVNGDSLFMTGNFKEFNVENQSSGLWDECNAVASTADYLASIDSATQAGLDVNSDLQLAIALQQQEFEEQQQQRQGSQQRHTTGSSRLYTGSQVPRNGARHSSASASASASRPEVKQKEKCTIM